MAQEKKPMNDGVIARHSVVIQTINMNDLRVTCKSDAFMRKIIGWYADLTKAAIKPQEKQKYTNAVILDSARKDKHFGEYDWENIIIDYMLSLGYELMGDGQSTKITKYEDGRQEIKLIFLSTANKIPSALEGGSVAPPQYTHQ
eukprot:135106_1